MIPMPFETEDEPLMTKLARAKMPTQAQPTRIQPLDSQFGRDAANIDPHQKPALTQSPSH